MSVSGVRAPALYVAGKVANLLLAPLSMVVLPGVLGEEGYGRYGYWFGLISVYLVLFDMGTQPMLRRYLPEMAARHPGESSRLFRMALLLKLVPVPFLLLGLLLTDQPGISVLLLAAGLMAALATNLADLLYAYEHMGWHSVVIFGRKVARLVLVPLLFLLWEVPGILAALLAAELLGLLIAAPGARLARTPPTSLTAPFMRYYRQGALMLGGMLLSILLGRLPVFAAEWSGQSLELVGRIALCVDLTYFALKELINAVSEALLPRLVVAHTSGRAQQLQRLIGLNYRIVNLLGVGMITLGLGLASTFLLLLGEEFYRAEQGFQILLPAVLLSGWNLIHNQLLQLEQRSHLVPVNQGVGFLATLGAVALWWPQLTVEHLATALLIGVAAATLVSYRQTLADGRATGTVRAFAGLVPGATTVTALLLAAHPRGIVEAGLALLLGGGGYLMAALLLGGVAAEERTWLRRAVAAGER